MSEHYNKGTGLAAGAKTATDTKSGALMNVVAQRALPINTSNDRTANRAREKALRKLYIDRAITRPMHPAVQGASDRQIDKPYFIPDC